MNVFRRGNRIFLSPRHSRALTAAPDPFTAAAGAKPAALTDTFGRFHNYLRISVTERCNLRCTYCMPEQGIDLTPTDDLMSIDETKRVVSVFTALGVDKIR
jgi:sulfatase maturation enzyme AslB (radical SAM superfamily)